MTQFPTLFQRGCCVNRYAVVRVALTLFLVVTLVSAGYYKDTPYKIKESIEGPPRGWFRQNPAPPDHLIELKIALPQPHFPILEKHLWEVSNPKHDRYGAYLSKEETEELMAPHPETIDVVSQWLSSHGIEEEHLHRSSAQDWITIRIPVALAEEMLDTKYHVYIHSDSGESIIRTTGYSLPESLHEHVELIQPTTMFVRLGSFASTLHWSDAEPADSQNLQNLSTGSLIGPAGNQIDASCNHTITIDCLRQLYNAVGYNTSTTNGNKIAVTAYLGEYANDQDLQQFFRIQNPAAYESNYTYVSINGGLNNQSSTAAGPEANLDIQFAFGLTYPTPATLYSVGGSPPFVSGLITPTNNNEPYANWLDYVLSQQNPPQTISTSYGDDEQTVPYSYAVRVCTGFAALGARGISLLFASGDDGVGSTDPVTQKCYNNGANKIEFIPKFPSSCPYVTTVGGTNHIPETALFFSSGGFSNYFSRPTYQEGAVRKYLQTLAPGIYDGLYNPHGRAYPDVAAQGLGFHIIHQGQPFRIAGTSCSAPVFAGIVSMLNDARISAGKPPLGFLNPWLYEIGWSGLNDITMGNNPGCGTEGFNATEGWDPVTGLGTPNFEKLLALAMTI